MTRPAPDIRDHPEYPFRRGEAESIRRAASCYIGAPQINSREGEVLSAFIALGRRFAFLERLIQGEVLCNLPFHKKMSGEVPDGTPEGQGERLAGSERALLDAETGCADELASILDGIGIKVISPMPTDRDASGSPPDLPRPLFGAFTFEEGAGPALLVGRPMEQPVASFVLAHEFGHLVADFDPYRSRFCRWDPHSLRNLVDTPEERRADRFARALLMPEDRFRSVLCEIEKTLPKARVSTAQQAPESRNALPETLDDRALPSVVDQLAAIFEVPAPLVHLRLEDLGLDALPQPGSPARGKTLLTTSDAPGKTFPAGDGEAYGHVEPLNGLACDDQVAISCLALPDRYVNLSLAAFSAAILKPDNLAAFLDTTQAHAMRVVSWANLPIPDAEHGL